MNHRFCWSVLCALGCLWSGGASASYAIFAHGSGIQSLGMGGIAFTSIDDTYIAGTNPALLHHVGDRVDFGVDWLAVSATGFIRDNAAGADDTYKSDRVRHFFIPQIGYARRLTDRLTVGVSAFSAGIGTDFSRSPYARFGGAPRAKIALTQSGIALAASFEVMPGHVFGVSVNPAYQVFELEGLEVFSSASVHPERFSDQGKDGSLGVSVTLAWSGTLLPWLDAGLSFRSRTITQRHDRYKGLLPDEGRLQAPAVWGGGLAVTPFDALTVAVDAQRVEYGSEQAYSNSLRQLEAGQPYGSPDGPGFGWNGQNIYKLGVSYKVTPTLQLFGGFSYGTKVVPNEEMLFGILAPGLARTHYTAGVRYRFDVWEINGYAAYVPRRRQNGRNSIPEDFGGGEADAEFQVYPLGISFGRTFGGGG